MAEEKKSRFKRRPLSRRLGSKRRKKAEEEAEEDEDQSDDSGDDDSSSDDSSSDSSDDDDAPAATEVVASDITQPISVGAPVAPAETPPNKGEKLIKFKAGATRFFREFGQFLLDLGQGTAARGKKFGDEVVKPFSTAFFEAMICIMLSILTLSVGFLAGRTLHAQTRRAVVAEPAVRVPQGRGLPFPGQPGAGRGRPAPLPVRKTTDGAEGALTGFLHAINGGRYKEAYAFLSPNWQGELSFEAFKKGYSSSKNLVFKIEDAVSLGEDRVQLEVKLELEENGQKRDYQATYLALKTDSGWKLDSGTVR